MPIPHPFDIVAILLGIFLALRRVDLRGEDGRRYPRVTAPDFEVWRARMLAAYSIGTTACFGKVVGDFAFLFYLQRNTLDLAVQRTIGVGLDLAWILALIGCWVARGRARRLGRSLGIHPNTVSAPPPEPDSMD